MYLVENMRHRSNILNPTGLTSMTDYSPYGNILQRYSFQGRRTRFMTTYHSLSRIVGKRDSTTLLDYRGARFSDPHVGGFISIDPLADKFPGWSPYNYVACNPIKLVDPDGKAPTDYYRDANGLIVWRNSTAQSFTAGGQTFTNIGSSYAEFNGSRLTYHYQNGSLGNLSPSSISLRAVSGRPNANGQFDYSVSRQMDVGNGPIPEGDYSINTREAPYVTTLKSAEGYLGALYGKITGQKRGTFPGGRYAWGNGRIDINPDEVISPRSDNPFDIGVKRKGFTIHGGMDAGSAGCIDLMGGFDLFRDLLFEKKGASDDIYLKVDYNYKEPIDSPWKN